MAVVFLATESGLVNAAYVVSAVPDGDGSQLTVSGLGDGSPRLVKSPLSLKQILDACAWPHLTPEERNIQIGLRMLDEQRKNAR